MDSGKILAVFRSRQQAIAFSSELTRLGIKNDLVSTPSRMARGCGVSVGFAQDALAEVRKNPWYMRLPAFDGFYRWNDSRRRYEIIL